MGKKLLYTLLLLLFASTISIGQTQVFHEDFETPSGADSVVSTGNPGWAINTTYFTGGTQSFHSAYVLTDTTTFTSVAFSTTGLFNISLTFAHICKVEFFDSGIIEVSNDNGATWVRLMAAQYATGGPPVGAPFGAQGNKFTAASYSIWSPANAAAIPDNSTWWKNEVFNLSALIANVPQAMIRFRLYDGNANGSLGNYGWIVDNIVITGAACELIPPTIVFNAPVLNGSVAGAGPYTVSANITDASGIATATLTYNVNGSLNNNIPMTSVGGGNYEGNIPGANVGDTICYSVSAIDSSACSNSSTLPTTGSNCFTIVPVPPIVTVGTGTTVNTGTTYPSPYGNWYWGARHQFMIQASELVALGVNQAVNVLSLAFDVATVQGTPLTNFEIKMGHTTATDVTTWITTPMTNVFNTPTYTESFGWNIHTFQTPFSWNATDNVVVEVCFNNTSFTNNAIVNQTATSFTSSRWYRADAAGVCANTGQTGTSTDRPNMQLMISPPQPLDAGIISINQPTGTTSAGSLVTPDVTLRNFGTQPLTAIPVEYKINNVVAGNFTWMGTLAPSATVTTTLPDFTSPVGNYDLCIYTQLGSDGYLPNDTACKAIFGVPVMTLPYIDDFDLAGPSNWYANPTTGATIWELGTPSFGATSSSFSAPNCWDINLNSSYGPNATAYLNSPIFNIVTGTNMKLSFWQNRNTQVVSDGFRLQYTFNGGTTWQTLGIVNQPNATNWYTVANLNGTGQPGWDGFSNGWVKSFYLLDNTFNNQTVQFRFAFISNGFTQVDGVSIDNFTLIPPSPEDAGVESIVTPINQAAAGSSQAAEVVVKNFGLNTLTAFDVVYDIGAGPVPTPWIGSLAPGSSVNVQLGFYTVPTGVYSFCAYTSLNTDGDNTNDSLCRSTIGVPILNISFTDNFDTANIGWVATTTGTNVLTKWELGTPAFGATSSSFSAPSCWDVNLTTGYTANASCVLTSPYFDFSSAVSTVLSFYQNRNVDIGGDGLRVEYAINNGAWATLGGVGQGTNWYTNVNLTSSNQPGFDGTSGGWIKSSLPLPALFDNVGIVQFRFFFTSNGFTQNDGISIDNFDLFVPVTVSASSQNLQTANSLLLPGVAQTIRARVRNEGSSPLANVNVTLELDNVVIVTDPLAFSPVIPGFPNNGPTTAVLHTFSQQLTMSPGVHNLRVWTSDPNSSTDLNTSDDTTSLVVTVFDSVGTPYCNDFEGAQPAWVALNALNYGPSTKWQFGTPAQAVLNTASSGTNAWMTDLANNYGPRDSSGLFSPVFSVAGNTCYKVAFMHQYETEKYQDGGIVEYTTDGTATWKVLGGYVGDPKWFDTQFITGLSGVPPKPGFSGSSNGWKQAEHLISLPSSGSLMFRFRFASDNSVQSEGWSIDDFCFTQEPDSVCLISSVPQIAGNSMALGQNYPNPANAATTIDYAIANKGKVVMTITNLVGQVVSTPVSSVQLPGSYKVEIPLNTLSPGIYYYTLEFNGQRTTRKMVVTK